MSVQEIIESLKQQDSIKALKAKGFIGEISKGNQEVINNTIQAVKQVLQDKKYSPMQFLLAVKLCKDIIEQRPQKFMQIFQEEILNLILEIALFDSTNQSDNKGFNYFSDNPDQNEKMCGRSFFLLSLECIYIWARWFPVDSNNKITEFKKASMKLEQSNVKIPKVFKYFKNENEPQSKNTQQVESPSFQFQQGKVMSQTPNPDAMSQDPIQNANKILSEGGQLQQQFQYLCSFQQYPDEKIQNLLKDFQKYIDKSNHAMELILEDERNEKLFQQLFEIQQWTEQVQQEYLKHHTSSGLNWSEFRKKYQVTSIPDDNEALQKKIRQLEQDLEKAQQQINQKSDEIKHLEVTLQNKEQMEVESLSQLQQIIKQQNQEIEKLKSLKQQRDYNDEIQKYNEEIQELKQIIKSLQNAQTEQDRQNELNQLNFDIQSLKSQNQLLLKNNEQNNELKKQIQNLQNQISDYKIQLEQQQQCCENLIVENNNQLQQQIKYYEEEIMKQKNVISLQSARIESLESDLQKMDENNFILQKKINNLIYEQKYQANLQQGQTKKEQSLAELNQTVKRLIQEKSEFQEQNDKTMIQLVQVQDQLQELRLDLETKESENKSLVEKNTLLKNEVNLQLQHLRKFEQNFVEDQSISNSYQQLLEKYNQASHDRQKLQDELEQTQLDFQQNQDKETRRFNEHLNDLQEEINKLNSENSNLNKEILDLRENLKNNNGIHQQSTKRFNLSVISPQGNNNKNLRPSIGVESILDKTQIQKSPNQQLIKKKNEFW